MGWSNIYSHYIEASPHLKTGATRRNPEERLHWKFQLLKQLYEKGYERRDILQLFCFLDWLLALPKTLELTFQQQFIEYEATMSQPYISNIERRWIEESRQTVEDAKRKMKEVEVENQKKAKEAIEEAREEAREERLILERKLLRRLTHRRFGEHAAEQLWVLYEQIGDAEQLSDIAEWIIDCETAEDLQVRVQGFK